MNVLIKGVVGSTAYGLAHAGSDVDLLGIHATDTADFFTYRGPGDETIASHNPDITSHEIHKAVRLMYGNNPTVYEILWLDSYLEVNQFGRRLIDMRTDFLHRQGVRNSYLGYASQQLARLEREGRFAGSLDTRREKHARHLLRLLEQGTALYTTGQLTIKVNDPERLRDDAKKIARLDEGGLNIARERIANAEDYFDAAKSPIAEKPSYEAIDALLQSVRTHYWKAPSEVPGTGE